MKIKYVRALMFACFAALFLFGAFEQVGFALKVCIGAAGMTGMFAYVMWLGGEIVYGND